MSYVRFDSSTRSCHSIIRIWRMRERETGRVREWVSEKRTEWNLSYCTTLVALVRWGFFRFSFVQSTSIFTLSYFLNAACTFNIFLSLETLTQTHSLIRTRGKLNDSHFRSSNTPTHWQLSQIIRTRSFAHNQTRSNNEWSLIVVCALCETHSTKSTHCIDFFVLLLTSTPCRSLFPTSILSCKCVWIYGHPKA